MSNISDIVNTTFEINGNTILSPPVLNLITWTMHSITSNYLYLNDKTIVWNEKQIFYDLYISYRLIDFLSNANAVADLDEASWLHHPHPHPTTPYLKVSFASFLIVRNVLFVHKKNTWIGLNGSLL